MTTDLAALFHAVDATWPAASMTRAGPWMLREGQGAGKRVSAVTAMDEWTTDDISLAEEGCRALGQTPMFMIRPQDTALDADLDARGYQIVDPVDFLVAPVAGLTAPDLPRLSTFPIWPPLAVMEEIWAAGGIGPARLEVMNRARGPKTALMGRHDNHPVAVAYVACDGPVAMLHALEVTARARRQGVGRLMMHAAANWAATQGAALLAVLVVRENTAARNLYKSLGMSAMGHYLYRVKRG